MNTATIQVMLTEDGRWAVESDGSTHDRFYFLSRAEAIAAGVQKALEHDGLLMIHGVDGQMTELELMGHVVNQSVRRDGRFELREEIQPCATVRDGDAATSGNASSVSNIV